MGSSTAPVAAKPEMSRPLSPHRNPTLCIPCTQVWSPLFHSLPTTAVAEYFLCWPPSLRYHPLCSSTCALVLLPYLHNALQMVELRQPARAAVKVVVGGFGFTNSNVIRTSQSQRMLPPDCRLGSLLRVRNYIGNGKLCINVDSRQLPVDESKEA